MPINLQEPLATWFKNNLQAGADENTKFTITIGAVTPEGKKDVQVDVDLIWFIILYVNDHSQEKFNVVLELLKNQIALQRFKITLSTLTVKRIIAEFLFFNFQYLDALKNYIDFGMLNDPFDFITYALFVKRTEGLDTPEVSLQRLKTISAVLDTGFKVNADLNNLNQSTVIAKVLSMEDIDSKYEIAFRLHEAGYVVFSGNPANDATCAVYLIDGRQIPLAASLIEKNLASFKNIKLRVPGSNGEIGNLADYYYWVREDLDAMRYVKEKFGIELTPST